MAIIKLNIDGGSDVTLDTGPKVALSIGSTNYTVTEIIPPPPPPPPPVGTIISNIELQPMKRHTQADGSRIGGVPPSKYDASVIAGALVLTQSGNSDPKGKGYPAFEIYPATIPIPVNTGNIELSFTMIIDDSTAASANVFETDTLIITGGKKYNLSGQRHNKTGQIDVGSSDGSGWINTRVMTGPLIPMTVYNVKWTYAFDTVAGTCSVVSYACNDVVYPIPASAQNIKAAPSNWTEGIMLQIQQGNNPPGMPLNWEIRDIQYRIW